MSFPTILASPHAEHHQHEKRTGPSSISSLLNRTGVDDQQLVPKKDKEGRQTSPQPQPVRRDSDQLTVAGSSSSSDTPLIKPMSPYQYLPTPNSPAAPVLQYGNSNSNHVAATHSSASVKNQATPTSPAKSAVVVHHYEMIPRSTEDTRSGVYASFSLKDTSLAARQHHSSKVISTSSPRPFACTECDQTFNRAHNLKSHLATHSTDRPFECNACFAKFRRLHDLKRHQKLHTGERPYICNTCHRCFSRLDALNRHQRTEGGSACHYRQRNTTPTMVSIEELMPNVAPQDLATSPTLKLQQPQRPNIPRLDLRHLSTNDHITLPSSSPHHPYFQQTTPSSSPQPLPEQQSHHHPSHRLSESPESFTTLQTAYAQLYDQYHNIQEGMYRHQANAEEVKSLKQSLYDLQVENRVLRSLVVERQPNKDNTMKNN